MNEIIYKPISKTQLAVAYKVPTRTLRLWLKPIENEIGEYLGQSYNPRQVGIIVALIGKPIDREFVIEE